MSIYIVLVAIGAHQATFEWLNERLHATQCGAYQLRRRYYTVLASAGNIFHSICKLEEVSVILESITLALQRGGV